MIKIILTAMMFIIFGMVKAFAGGSFEKDIINTSLGDLEITFIGHGSLILKFGAKTIHVDPFGQLTDYSKLPKADAILLTHEHMDHTDVQAISTIRTKDTILVLTKICADKLKEGTVLKNGDSAVVLGINVEAVPAYNIKHKRPDGMPFHPKGDGNGYVLTFGDKRIYIAGDTENIPEMKELKKIDYAFLSMNLPYTMTPQMAAEAANAFKPKVLYPYHFGETNTSELVNLLKSNPEIEVRIRSMK
jgi:L-ascorbate metabolism protein UlaG (beta-lactamase superfamily)